MRKAALALMASTFLLAAATPSVASVPPRIVVDRAGGRGALYVEVVAADDGTAQRHLLKEAVGVVRPVDAGWDPKETAAFVTRRIVDAAFALVVTGGVGASKGSRH